MYVNYPVCFLKEEDDSYSVCIPDFPGAFTCGENFEDANRMAIDLLAGCVYYNQRMNIENPKPSDYKNLDLSYVKDLWEVSESRIEVIPVGVDVYAYAKEHFCKMVHKNVTVESWINDEAMSLGINFSKILTTALLKEIERLKKTA